jgi:hypothetical protein
MSLFKSIPSSEFDSFRREELDIPDFLQLVRQTVEVVSNLSSERLYQHNVEAGRQRSLNKLSFDIAILIIGRIGRF